MLTPRQFLWAFITEQSEGEWDEDVIRADVERFMEMLEKEGLAIVPTGFPSDEKGKLSLHVPEHAYVLVEHYRQRAKVLEAKGGAFLDAIDAKVADPNKPGAQKAADEARQAFRAALREDEKV